MDQQIDIDYRKSAARKSRTYRRWFGPTSTIVAWLALTAAVCHPPHGLGLPACWLEATSGVECPGCGLSRSLSCVVRGMLPTAWDYHPFGIVFTALFLLIAFVSVLPQSERRRIAALFERYPSLPNIALALLVGSFAGYGFLRAITSLFA